MIALLYLLFFAGYFWLIAKFTSWTYRVALEKGVSVLSARLLGGFVALAGLGLVFWDAIPTWYTHYHLCSTEAGLKVYQTPDEWAEANPELFAEIQLTKYEMKIRSNKTSKADFMWDEKAKGLVGEYFWELTPSAFNTYMSRNKVIDKQTGKTLFEVVDFAGHAGTNSIAGGANSWNDYKFWTVTGRCQDTYPSLSGKFKFQGRTYTDFSNQINGWHKK